MKESLIQGTREKFCRKEDFPLVEEDWVRNQLGKSDIHMSMDPDATTSTMGVGGHHG